MQVQRQVRLSLKVNENVIEFLCSPDMPTFEIKKALEVFKEYCENVEIEHAKNKESESLDSEPVQNAD